MTNNVRPHHQEPQDLPESQLPQEAQKSHESQEFQESEVPREVAQRANGERLALWGLLGIVTVALGWILWPFYGTILWSAIIAMVFAPLNRRLLVWNKGRRTLAALGTLFIVVMLVILPFTLISAALVTEAVRVFEQLQSGEIDLGRFFGNVLRTLPDWTVSILGQFGLGNYATIQTKLLAELSQAGKFFAGQALTIGQNTFQLLVNVGVASYLSFFLIRDGEALARGARHALPLDAATKHRLFARFTTVIRATVKGNLLVAAIQGALGGLVFWFLGVTGALLWALLMAFLSLLPAIGAALVWVPVALYFLFTGALWQGLALAAWGVLVIGLIDNLLRPILVGKDTRMPDYVVMISTLGGMAVFGVHGFVLGPVIAAMFISVWHLHTVAQGDV